jgi:ABC-2 type transport system permease protein
MSQSLGMLAHVARFELRYQAKSPVAWVAGALFFLLAFGSTTSDNIQIGGASVQVNAPYAIVQTTAVMSLFAMFAVVALVAGALVRDAETGFAPLLQSTSLTRSAYLFGRFLGASAASVAVLAAVPLGVALGSAMPWLDPERVGPFHLSHYLYALFAFGVPSLLVLGSACFALATFTRSLTWSYVGAVALLVGYIATRGFLSDPSRDAVAALTDPFGLSALSITTKYWTVAERNTQLPPMRGLLLQNRALWAALGALLFAVAFVRFRFELPAARLRARAQRQADDNATSAGAPPRPVRGPAARRADRRTGLSQLWRLTRFDVAFVLKSPAFFVLVGLGVANSLGALIPAGEFYGSPSYPVTRLMVRGLNQTFVLMPVLIALYYSGELVWRDRERRIQDVVDSTVAPDWVHLVPKIFAVTLVLLLTSVVGVLTAIVVQTARGYHDYDLPAYLFWFVLPTTASVLLLAVFAVFVQVLVPHKFVGWGVMLVYLVAQIALSGAGFEHNLYNYASTPDVPLSDMNRRGRFWIAEAWFFAYWGAFALVLTLVAYGLWPRGAHAPLRTRLRGFRRRMRGVPGVLAAIGLVGFAGTGAFIFYNTNVLNTYQTTDDKERHLADLERELLAFENVPQPRIVEVTLDVQIFPRQTRVITTGSYVIENRTGAAVDTLHLHWPERLRLERVELENARVQREYPSFQYRIYALDAPMLPGERRTVKFATTLEERGFPNASPLTRIVENGTFVDNGDIAPSLGISRQEMLEGRAKRRKYRLPPELHPAPLEDESARGKNLLRHDSDWVEAHLTVSTDADQIPLAPGKAVHEEVEGGRRTVRFKPGARLNHFFSMQSARYTVRRARAGNVDLAVYFHEPHSANVQRMLDTMQISLEMFSERFGPYQFDQARIIEFPAYADFAQAFANTVPYSENLGFIGRFTDPQKVDTATYVTAHEIAHQWWGHQLVPSDQQGATMLVESFAQYSALLVMERIYGASQIRRFLKYELDLYLRSRGRELREEQPLARVEGQGYIRYQKGTLAMYWLKEVVGEERVNRALRRLLERFAFQPAPYGNTRDFLAILREEAGPAHEALITDLFEKITLYDVKLASARSHARADGLWDVELDVEARKFYADGRGVETEAPLDEDFDVGAFSGEPGTRDFTAESVLGMVRQRLRSGLQTVRLVTSREPRFAGVDPYNMRIDRNSNDNVTAVTSSP